jgi:hypothetical protein
MGDVAPDAQHGDALPVCAANDLELGRCVTASGSPCTGAVGEGRAFAPFEPSDELASVVGPQGAEMFVLSARTTGIAPGDPGNPASPDNPEIHIVVITEGGAQIARYRGRTGFIVDGEHQVAAGLFVVLDGEDHAGERLLAHGDLVDAAGARRCGEVTFTAL